MDENDYVFHPLMWLLLLSMLALLAIDKLLYLTWKYGYGEMYGLADPMDEWR